MNSEDYCEIIKNYAIPSGNNLIGEQFIFQ